MSSDREQAILILIKSLKERFPNGRFQVHPNVQFTQTPSGGLGVIATSSIDKQEILLLIPHSGRLSVPNATAGHSDLRSVTEEIENRCQEYAETQYHARDFSFAVVMMYILGQKAKMDKKEKEESSSTTMSSQIDPWIKQANTWPSLEEMKQSNMYYLNDDPKHWINFIGKNQLSESIKVQCQTLHQVFEMVIYPVLKETNSIEDYCMTTTDKATGSEDRHAFEALWETFRYTYALHWSRAHSNVEAGGAPELLPLVEMFNGTSNPSQTNAHLRPYQKGNLSCTAMYSHKNLKKGDELIISYGEMPPYLFFLKFGIIPESMVVHDEGSMMDKIALFCPPSLIPTDKLRIKCLEEKNQYPVDGMKEGTHPLASLSPEDLTNYRSTGKEPTEVSAMRQYLILAHMATDIEVQRNIETGRLMIAKINTQKIGHFMCQIIDYNLQLLLPSHVDNNKQSDATTDKSLLLTSHDDMAAAKNKLKSNDDNCMLESALLVGRVCQRETLLQWRYIFEQQYNLTRSGSGGGGSSSLCEVCGRSYPKLSCSRCKWTGNPAQYCSRKHQKSDWKKHKTICKAKK